MANLSKFIEKLRGEIYDLSREVLKSPLLPETQQLEEASQENLDLHEKILESLKNYEIEHRRLLGLWKKRQAAWTEWIEYENKANDPNRFTNRGGTLLKEEKARKALEKCLPKLENEIKLLAAESPLFKIFGRDVKDIIEEDWDNFNKDKEEKKLAKKQQLGTNNNTMNITRKRPMTPGSTNKGTPGGKRGKIMLTTPNKPVSKSFIPNNGPTPTPKRGINHPGSKELIPTSPTYSEFRSHKPILQSTLNEPKEPEVKISSSNFKTPTKNSTNPKSPSTGSRVKMTPCEIDDKF